MTNSKKLLVSLLLLLAVPSFAQKITIQEAAEMAIKNNKDIRMGMLEVDQSKINVDRTWKQKFFTIDYNASVGKGLKNDLRHVQNTYQHYLSLTQPIFQGGKLKLNDEISKENLTLSQLTLDKTKKDTILSTVQAYINVYDALTTLDVYQKSKEALDENFKIQQGKYDLRMVTRPDFLESERAVLDMEATIASQEATISNAKESLAILIGFNNPDDIEIVPFAVDDGFTKNVDLQKDIDRLRFDNTEYQQAVKQIDINKKNVKLQKADYFPTINGVINYGNLNTENHTEELFKDKNYNGSLGVSFNWNLFNWGAKKDNVNYAKKTQEISEVRAEQTLLNQKAGIRNVYYQLKALEKSLDALKLAVERAEETYELEKERFENNLITMNDLLDAEAAVRQSRVNYTSSRLRYYYLVSQYGSYLD